MRLLVDTPVLFWWYSEPAKLSSRAQAIVSDGENTLLVSAATAWELSIKAGIGKLNVLPLPMDLGRYLREEGLIDLPITISQAVRAGLLPWHHRDRFDRLLVAQAEDLNVPIVSSDCGLDLYGIKRMW